MKVSKEPITQGVTVDFGSSHIFISRSLAQSLDGVSTVSDFVNTCSWWC
jgi:hypothetical protein